MNNFNIIFKDIKNIRLTITKDEVRLKFPLLTKEEIMNRLINFVENILKKIMTLNTNFTIRGTFILNDQNYYQITLYNNSKTKIYYLRKMIYEI